MNRSIDSPGIARFGPYEVDVRSGEVRKFGTRIRIGEQPLRILVLLMERPGELVTRDELRTRLWPEHTFVDFDHGLNSAMQRLRDSLSDTAQNAQWIETVPRRGYRFVAEVVWSRSNGNASHVPGASAGTAASPAVTAPESAAAVPQPAPRKTWLRPTIVALVAVIVLCAAGVVSLAFLRARRQVSSGKSAGRVMLVVLPFENLSGNTVENYFTDGLTEEMITQLGSVNPERLAVIARTTSMVYKHTSKDARQIGNELGADYLLESSVRRDGDQLRITVQLIRTRDQVHVWAHNYDRQISGSISLQEEVARAVAGQIEVALSPEYASRPMRPHPDPQANEAYLRGRFFWNQFTPDGYRKALAYFQQAIDRDPNFGEAYAGLADCYRFLEITDSLSPADASPKTLAAAQKAVMLDDGVGESHASLGHAMMDHYDWAGSEKEFARAIALNPSYSDVHRIYAALLGSQLRFREAWEQISEAMRTDPLSMPNNAELVRTLYYARDYDGALAQGQKAMQLSPGYYRTHFWMGRVYAQKHMYNEAIAEDQIVLKAAPDSAMALTELAYSLAGAGQPADARKILRDLELRAGTQFVPAYNLAVIHIALGENGAALKLIEKAYNEGDWAMLVLACEPRLDPLRDSSQFRSIVAKVGLPGSASEHSTKLGPAI